MTGDERSKKLKDFDERVRHLRSETGLEPEAEVERPPSVGGAGVQVGVELVAGVIGGALIGYGLDRWLETWPAFFLVFFFLGAAAGMLNAYRHMRKLGEVPDDRPNRH